MGAGGAISQVTLDALFVPESQQFNTFTPTALTRGPWRADAQHGGPPAALLGALTERELHENEFLAFIEVELTRSVPLTVLTSTVRRVQISRRVARVHAELIDPGEDQIVARASALAMRVMTDAPTPDATNDPEPWPELPGETATVRPEYFASGINQITYHRDAVTHRFTHGSFNPGAAHGWVRLKQAVIHGEPITPVQRTLAAADFGSGISAIYNLETSGFGLINANLTVTFERTPIGEWIGIDSRTSIGPQGTGTGITRFGDEHGVTGVVTQSLLGYRA